METANMIYIVSEYASSGEIFGEWLVPPCLLYTTFAHFECSAVIGRALVPL